MGRYVRGGENFEYEYLGDPSLCDLAFVSQVGRCEIFPEIFFIGVSKDETDLVFYLSGENDCIPVDNREHPFDVFEEFCFSTQRYLANADMASLLDILEESNGCNDRLSLLKMMTEAETVYISAQCYYTIKRHERPKLLEWLNTYLPAQDRLNETDLSDNEKITPVEAAFRALAIKDSDGTELPLLALKILENETRTEAPAFIVRDDDVAWETPILLDGELVNASTEIGEYDTPVF